MDDPSGVWDIKSLSAEEVVIYRDHGTPTIRYFTPLLQSASNLTIYGNPPAWGAVLWPKLQTLVIKQFCFARGLDYKPTDLTFLTEDFLQLLYAAPSLTRLKLNFKIDGALLVWNSNISISHTRMESLSIHLHHFVGGKGPFGVRLDLPALHTLEFLSIHCKIDPANEEDPICSGLTPKQLILPPLTPYELTLATSVLHCLPSIERLNLTGAHSNLLLRALHPRHSPHQPAIKSVLIPKLRTLNITDSDIDGETLLEVVSARLLLHGMTPEQFSTVESINMYNTPGVRVDDWNKVQAILEAGRVGDDMGSAEV